MKHSINGRHGHVFEMNFKRKGIDDLFIRKCIERKEAAGMDLMTEQLEGSWRVSRRYHTCWQCHNPTESVGGYKKPDKKDALFYECDSCWGNTKGKNKRKK